MSYDIAKTVVDVTNSTATVAFANSEGNSIEVSFSFEFVLSEGVRPARVVSEAIQILREALDEISSRGV